jgi:hypothetical protein
MAEKGPRIKKWALVEVQAPALILRKQRGSESEDYPYKVRVGFSKQKG